ncbi:MAG TPA: APC family permease [Puia sp.]|nr:APC family permease [Puia sp.]
MILKTTLTRQPSLKKVLGFSSLFAATLGGVASQTSFVTILNGAGNGGALFFVAIFLAFIVTLCNVFSYLELSLMMPKAGGPGTYAVVALGHFPSIVILLTAYVFASPFGLAAELNLLNQVIQSVLPSAPKIGLALLALFTILNLAGINIFASVQSTMVYILVLLVLLVGFAGLNPEGAKGLTAAEMVHQIKDINISVFSLMILALWSFAGLEYVCPLLEEATRPERTLPRAMIGGLLIMLLLYSLIAYAGVRQIPPSDLADPEIPHFLLVNSIFGKLGGFVILLFALTTSSAIINATLASISRMVYGMAHHHQLPPVFGKLHLKWKTPWVAILFVSFSVTLPFMILRDSRDTIILMVSSATSLWLVGYILAHVDVIVLKERYKDARRPFKTPLYPLPQLVGIAGMIYAIYLNSPSADMSTKIYYITGAMILTAVLFAFFWVKLKMKRRLFEAEPMEKAIAD